METNHKWRLARGGRYYSEISHWITCQNKHLERVLHTLLDKLAMKHSSSTVTNSTSNSRILFIFLQEKCKPFGPRLNKEASILKVWFPPVCYDQNFTKSGHQCWRQMRELLLQLNATVTTAHCPTALQCARWTKITVLLLWFSLKRSVLDGRPGPGPGFKL